MICKLCSCLAVFILYFAGVNGYYPIICVPGIIDPSPHKLENACNGIAKKHNGTEVVFIYPGGLLASILPMWVQVEMYRPIVNKYFAKYSRGVHVIAHSQGTLVMRALIQSTADHPVKNFISLNGPFMGFFGIPVVCKTETFVCGIVRLINVVLQKLASEIFYTPQSQYTVSMAGYYHGLFQFGDVDRVDFFKLIIDPQRESEFLKESIFLPVINNLVEHKKATEYKTNFLRLNRFVMIASSGDDVVNPYQSEIGGFYDNNLNLVPMKNQKVYTNDTIGLRTLDNDGRLTLITIDGAGHEDITHKVDLIDKFILPYCD